MDFYSWQFLLTGSSWNTDRGVYCYCERRGLKPQSTVKAMNLLQGILSCWTICRLGSSEFAHKVIVIRPERWWSMLLEAEVSWKLDGRLKHCWRANRLSDERIGTKDPSNHLVAGLYWNFPKENWCIWELRLVEIWTENWASDSVDLCSNS